MSFLTMEYLPGETLSARIRNGGSMARAQASPIIRQLAEALDAAHRAGVIHRDFKSANVMLVPAGDAERAVITDFGLAVRLREADSSIDGLVGTPAYMSPEQVTGGRIGPAADLYALGVALYGMATGRLPFTGSTPLETARARLKVAPAPPSRFAEVDPDWERAILRLLSKDPQERYTSGRDVMLALEGNLAEEKRTRFSLPAERDSFVGRENELALLAEQLEPPQLRSRVRTVLGAGGTGKTRLALRYGWESLPRWPGGVWFCDLSEVRTVDDIVSAVARSLDVPLGKDEPVVKLGHAIAGRGRSLVILDNFEQVREHAPATLGKWLERCPETSFLVTSQERLSLVEAQGEGPVRLEPLDPSTHAVELFELRAQLSRPAFRVDAANRSLVLEIVTRLDGLPLAIELAASRLRMLSLSQLRDRLNDRFALLADGKGGRHATLRATLDWSWELLAPWEIGGYAGIRLRRGVHSRGRGSGDRPLRVPERRSVLLVGSSAGHRCDPVPGGQELVTDASRARCPAVRDDADGAGVCDRETEGPTHRARKRRRVAFARRSCRATRIVLLGIRDHRSDRRIGRT